MISRIDNSLGFPLAYIVWYVVNSAGERESGAERVFVEEIWIHKFYREDFGKFRMIAYLIPQIMEHPEAQNAKYVYWYYRKKKGKVSRLIPIKKIVNQVIKRGYWDIAREKGETKC